MDKKIMEILRLKNLLNWSFGIYRLTCIFQIEVKEPGCAIFRHTSRYICAGDTSGKVP